MGEGINISGHVTGDGINIGSGNISHVNKTTVTVGATLDDFTTLLKELRGALNEEYFDPKVRRALTADLDVIEGEVADETPSGAIIQSKLKSMAETIRTVAAIGSAATTLPPLLHQALEWAQRLFS